MDGFLAFSRRLQDWIHDVLGMVSAALLLIITLFAMLEIIRRYILSVVFEWGQDAIVVGMVATVALYFCVTQTRRSHLVMSAVIQVLHAKQMYTLIGLLRIAVSIVITVFCAAICITGWSTVEYALNRNLLSYSLVIPLWPFYLILMIGFGLMAFVAFLQTIEDIISFVRGEHINADIELTTDV